MKRSRYAAAGAVSIALYSSLATAQVVVIPVAPSNTPQVPQQPVGDPRDTPEEIAKDAARDLKDSSFYNKPGATRAQYDADWQTCRLIARGSLTPGGSYTYAYNPAVMSPLAAGIGGGIGAIIGSAIIEGQLRRANRRACLMYKGWRLVEVPAAEAARVAALPDDELNSYFNAVVGAQTVEGKVTEVTNYSLKPDSALNLEAPLAGAPSLAMAKKTDDPRVPIGLEEGQGALVLAFSRPDAASAGRSALLQFHRYDMERQDLAYQPRDWKKRGDFTTYSTAAASKDRKAPYEIHVLRLTAGYYVIDSIGVGPGQPISSNCFGAPVVFVPAGKAVYIGDLFPFMNVNLSTGEKLYAGLGWALHLEQARTGLAAFQPALASTLEEAKIRNGATYGCAATTMHKWELPGVPQVGDPGFHQTSWQTSTPLQSGGTGDLDPAPAKMAPTPESAG